MNLQKLQQLRDGHASLHDASRSASERARVATTEAQAARLLPSSDERVTAVVNAALALPLAELVQQDLTRFGVPKDFIPGVVNAERRAAALRNEAAELSRLFRNSARLISRLNEFALSKGVR